MKRILLASAAMLAAAAPLRAWGQGAPPVSGPYFTVAGGNNILQALFTHPTLVPANEPAARYRSEDGFVVAASAGWGRSSPAEAWRRPATTTLLTAGTGANFAGQAIIGLGFPIARARS